MIDGDIKVFDDSHVHLWLNSIKYYIGLFLTQKVCLMDFSLGKIM